MTTGVCPGCGAPVAFAVGSSRVAACKFCGALVARTGQNLTLVGKVAELVPTGSHIAVGARGAYLGEAFTVAGRTQMRWTQGVWDEWYAAFDNGRVGWLAEAQGRYYITFLVPVNVPLPPANQARPGLHVDLPGVGLFTMTDLKEAQRVSAEGELPEVFVLGETHRSADMEGPHGAFATIDYGHGRPGEPLQVFVGRQVTLAEIGLHGGVGQGSEPGPEAMTLACAKCGAPLTRRVPEQTVRITCGSCGALLDTSQGAMRVIQVLDRMRNEPPIPLGTSGKLFGEERVVVGYMVRGCDVDNVHYTWEELLLYEPKTTGFTWLVLSDGHWSFAEPVSAAEVEEGVGAVTYQDDKYRLFSRTNGVVEHVLGEFYWQVSIHDRADLEDYIAPPLGLSVERTADEVNWSYMRYLTPDELSAAFPGHAPAPFEPVVVGALQPWPLQSAWSASLSWIVGGIVAAVVLFIVFLKLPHTEVVTHTFVPSELTAVDPKSGDPADLPPGGKVMSFLSEPFELNGHQAVEVRMHSDVQNAWAYIEGGLIEQTSGQTTVFGLETAYYSGVEGGESWSEGSQSASQTLSAPRRGTYMVRADLEWDPKATYMPNATLEVVEGTASPGHFFLLLGVLCLPLLLLLHRRSFEERRWKESNVRGSET